MSIERSGSEIPVVFASNNEYAPYLYVALTSLIAHAGGKNQYSIYILHTGLKDKHMERLESLGNAHIQVKCINVESCMDGIAIKGNIHLTVETCYRLFIAELFPQYDRVLYIDSDTLILSDVADLYYSSLNGKTAGAVHDVVCTFLKSYYPEHIGMDVEDGFNAGILVIDTARFREKKIKEKCIKWLVEDSEKENRTFVYMDQDVLNLALKGDVCFLDSAWNFQWMYFWRLDTIYPEYREAYVRDSREAKIIHYAGDKKPWQRPDLEKAELFWEAARRTPYYEEILFANMGSKQKNELFKNHIFPFSEVTKNSKIILYGAGDVGRDLYRQNELVEYVKILLWVDRDPGRTANKIGRVCGVEELIQFPQVYDYVLIAIDDERICGEVKKDLTKKGISAEKIIWSRYRRE